MKTLNVALIEHLEDADFSPTGTGTTKLKAIREGILDESSQLPALIFEVLPSDFDEVSGAYTDTIIVSIVGSMEDESVAELSMEVTRYILAMLGQDIKGLLIQNLSRPFGTRRDFDPHARQVQYLQSYEITWSGENL